jgi:hypothetical protein
LLLLCCVVAVWYVSVRAGERTRAPAAPGLVHRQTRVKRGPPGFVPRDHRPLPRPQNPTGSAWRIVKVPTTQGPSWRRRRRRREVVKPRPKPSPDLGRTLPTPAAVLLTAPGITGIPLASRETAAARVLRREPVPRPKRWSRGDSNPGPPPCKGGALPAKLRPRARLPTHRPARVGAPGLEPGTSALSGPRSNQLSYAPMDPSVLRGGPSPHAQDGARGVSSRPPALDPPDRTWRRRPPRHPWRPCQAARPSRDGNASGLGAHRCRIITRRLDTGPRLMAASP